jgi:hypothetical protein
VPDPGDSLDPARVLPLKKCLLLQQWFRIDPDLDPEPETRFNNLISFKKILSQAMDQPSPNHRTLVFLHGNYETHPP